MPPAQKKPMDHLKKGELNDDDRTFSFEHGGKTFTSPPLPEVLNPRFFRQTRKLAEMDATFTMLETMFADVSGALDAMDEMGWEEFNSLSSSLGEALGVSMGESVGSSS